MKEIPMLFSTPMVQAILQGRKTMTRRIMSPQPGYCNHSDYTEAPWKNEPPAFIESAADPYYWYCRYCGNGIIAKNDYKGIKCRYGKPGDLLWVRESYKIEGTMSHGESVLGVRYKAGSYWKQNDSKEVFNLFHSAKSEGWRPSIHLPKIAARIWLQVTDVRVERLQDISDDDALGEGIEWKIKFPDEYPDLKYYRDYEFKDRFANGIAFQPRNSFFSLWRKINGHESYISNPWVWCIKFSVLSTTGKPDLQNIKAIS